MRTKMTPLLAGAALAAILLRGPGCTSMSREDAQANRDEAAVWVGAGTDLRADLSGQLDAARMRLEDALDALEMQRAAAEQANIALLEVSIARADEWLAPAGAVLAAWDEKLETWDEGQGGAQLIGQIGGAVLPFLPPGWQAPAVLILGIGGSLARAANRSKALNSLAASTVKLADRDPTAKELFASNADALRQTQTPGARAAIDAAQGKRSRLPI